MGVHNLVHESIIQRVLASKTVFVRKISGNSHRLRKLLSVHTEGGKLSKGGVGLECGPRGHVVPGGWQSVVLIAHTSLCKDKSGRLGSRPQVEVGQLHGRHISYCVVRRGILLVAKV